MPSKKLFLLKCVSVGLLLTTMDGLAVAQTGQRQQVEPAQTQRTFLNSAQFVDAAVRIVRSIEANQAAQIWDTASNVMKIATTKERFTTTVRARIIASGPFVPQDWYTVTRVRVAVQTPNVPAGDYLSVGLIGTDNKGISVRTTVSFHLDADNNWRLAGYNIP